MKKRLLTIALIIITITVLVACGSTPQESQPEQVQEETSVVYTMSQDSYDKGLEAIDIMFEYIASHSGDTAMEKLQSIQSEINDEKDFVSSFINVFIVDITLEREQEEIFDQIDVFQEELERRKP